MSQANLEEDIYGSLHVVMEQWIIRKHDETSHNDYHFT